MRNLLLHADRSVLYPVRLQAAVAIAREYDAFLTGLCGVGEDPGTGDVDGKAEWHGEAETAASQFRAAAEAAGIRSEWRVPGNDVEDPVLLYARCYQLVVVGKPDPEDPATHVQDGLVERLILHSGRPVLVVPRTGMSIGQKLRAMVAWDAGRAAARALYDAAPLLTRAGRVTLLSVNPPASASMDEVGYEIVRVLEREATDVSVDRTFSDHRMGLADELLSRAADGSYGLLVAGVQREHVLGEVRLRAETAKLLANATLPILFSA